MIEENTPPKEARPENQEVKVALDGATCSAFDLWWTDQENGCPTLVLDNDEQFAHAVWNAAIKAAGSVAWEKRDQWDEGNGYSPTKAAAAEEIGYSIHRLSVPNAKRIHPHPKEQQ